MNAGHAEAATVPAPRMAEFRAVRRPGQVRAVIGPASGT